MEPASNPPVTGIKVVEGVVIVFVNKYNLEVLFAVSFWLCQTKPPIITTRFGLIVVCSCTEFLND
jgi:hypothetical protein